MSKRNKRFGAALLSVVAVIGAILVATGAFASADSASQASQAASLLNAPSAAQVAAFPVLGQPATASDALSTSPHVAEGLVEAEGENGVNPSLGRTVLASAAVREAIVPGRETMCLVTLRSEEQVSVSCTPEHAAEEHGLGTAKNTNNERYSVTGVFPAAAGASNLRAVSESGAEVPIELSPQGGYATSTSTKPTALRWTGADGAQHSRKLYWPPLN